jgi:predicted Ser/Thr protein kinase
MPLIIPDKWKFEGCGFEMPVEAHLEFLRLISAMVRDVERPKWVYEDFKTAFGNTGSSSDTGWAESDMSQAMGNASDNAALYVVSFYSGIERVREHGVGVPSVTLINRILADHEVPLKIEGQHLIQSSGDIEFDSTEEDEPKVSRPFVLGPVIGNGTFGAVHKITRKTKIGEYHFAMKLLAPSVFIENKERARTRFIREMKVLERVQHRGIVPLLEAGLDVDDTPYILMPFIDGKELDKALAGAEPAMVFEAFNEILRALAFAHHNNIIHRDLKPSNILMRAADQQPIILDFGCAFFLDEIDPSLTTQMIGTPGYIPQEVYENPKLRDARQDVFACGVMLYQSIMGRLPRLNRYQLVEETFEGFAGIDSVIQAALAPEDDRTRSAEEMRQQLGEVAANN